MTTQTETTTETKTTESKMKKRPYHYYVVLEGISYEFLKAHEVKAFLREKQPDVEPLVYKGRQMTTKAKREFTLQ